MKGVCVSGITTIQELLELLELDKFVSVHHRNLKCLAIKLFKTLIGISPDIMTDVFLLNTFSV